MKHLTTALHALAGMLMAFGLVAMLKHTFEPKVFYTTLTVDGFAVTKVKTTIVGKDTTTEVKYFTKPGLNDYRNVRVVITKDSM
jgi:hypothetical protein